MKFIKTIGRAIYKVVFRHTIAREKAAEEYHQRMLARFAGDGIDELLEAERKAAAYDMTRTQQQACKAPDAEYEAWVQTQALIEHIRRKATT